MPQFARKNLVEYDNVINQQRDIIYKLRQRILEAKDLKEEISEKLGNQLDRILLLATSVENTKLDFEKVVVGFLEIVPFDDASVERLNKEIEKAGSEGI